MKSPVRPLAHPARISSASSPLLMELRAARIRHDHGDGPCPFITEAIRMVNAGTDLNEVGAYLLRCGKPYSFVQSLGIKPTDGYDLPFSGIDLESDMDR
jgi:hypothetical protein